MTIVPGGGHHKGNINVKGHIFAIEENPGFDERYPAKEDKIFLVLSDMDVRGMTQHFHDSTGDY
jgi:hypothetical protein